jgi:hypothetical protein
LPVLVAFWLEPLEAFGRLLNRSDVFVKNDLWRGRGTDNFREPPQVGRAPIGPAGQADRKTWRIWKCSGKCNTNRKSLCLGALEVGSGMRK